MCNHVSRSGHLVRRSCARSTCGTDPLRDGCPARPVSRHADDPEIDKGNRGNILTIKKERPMPANNPEPQPDESQASRDDALFWDLALPLIAEGRVEEGTLMSSRCVRANGEFVALPEYRDGDLVVKLPKARVAGLIEAGDGLPFAPATKVFSEWVQVPARNEALWAKLLDESIHFAEATSAKKAAKKAGMKPASKRTGRATS